jgi:hypothetical protein
LDGTGASSLQWTWVNLPVLGAEEKGGDMIHLLQGRGAEKTWDYDAATATWTGRTNRPGWLQASVWDATQLPALTKVGEGGRPTALAWVGDAEGRWLREHELLWSSTTELRGGGELGEMQVARAESVVDGWSGRGRRWTLAALAGHAAPGMLAAVDVSECGVAIVSRSELLLGGNQ